jgi:hypothetical protein
MADDVLDASFRFRLPRQQLEQLAEAAAAEGHRSMSSKVRQLVSKGLEPPGVVERHVYGVDCERSAVSGKIYEMGSGSLPREQQDRLALAEQAAGRRLTQGEAQRLLRGDSLENSVADAAASIEDLKS